MKATLLLVISGFGLLLAGASSADSQDLSGSYYCTADASGGLVLNEATRKWEGSSFHAEGDKFALAMRFVKRSSKPIKEDWRSNYYEVGITRAGDNQPAVCHSTSPFPEEGVTAKDVAEWDSTFECLEWPFYYHRFNMKSGHFLEFYTAGGGIDESEDTPSVTGGTCLKIK